MGDGERKLGAFAQVVVVVITDILRNSLGIGEPFIAGVPASAEGDREAPSFGLPGDMEFTHHKVVVCVGDCVFHVVHYTLCRLWGQEFSEQSLLRLGSVAHLAESHKAKLHEVVGEAKTELDLRGEVSDAVPHDMNRDEAISPRCEVDVGYCVA